MIDEVWEEIESSNYYFISNYGNIKSVDRCVERINTSKLGNTYTQSVFIKGQTLKLQESRSGYLKIRVGCIQEQYVHRLVAKGFVKGYKDGFVVNHIDGNKTNNYYKNLEWVSPSDNQKHSYEVLGNTSFGRCAIRFEGTVYAYDYKTNELVAVMCGNKEMREKGFDFRLVSAVLKGKRNKHKGCYFKKVYDAPSKSKQSSDITPSYKGVIKVCDVDGNLLYESTLAGLRDKGYTIQRIIDVIKGKAVKHKNLKFLLKEGFNER